MRSLLHLDCSINGPDSISRQLGSVFADRWRELHPDGKYVHRDLAATPVPPTDAHSYAAGFVPESRHTAEQAAGWAVTKPLVEELLAADVVLLDVPMHNFGIPVALKCWLDRVVVPRFFAAPPGRSELRDTRFVIATARGGRYGPGSPYESFDHQEPHLRSILKYLGVEAEPVMVHAEMTRSVIDPKLAAYRVVFDASLAQATSALRELAERLAPHAVDH